MSTFQLLYRSESTEAFDVGEDIDRILHYAKDYNEEREITGVLLYKGGSFLQLLEGPEDEVKDLFGSIARDSRHRDLEVVYQEDSGDLIFPHWTMAYQQSDLYSFDIQEKLDDFLHRKKEEGGFSSSDEVLSFLRRVKFAF